MHSSPTKVEAFFAISEAALPAPLTLFTERVPAGFASPADAHSDTQLDLNTYLAPKPETTFLTRVSGSSMIGAGIFDGCLLVVDRSLIPRHRDIVIAVIDGEILVKRYFRTNDKVALHSENPDFPHKEISAEHDFYIWGVVRHCIHSFRKK